jgi:arginyl-tRNA synthetase
MKTLISILQNKFQQAIETAYPSLKKEDIPLEVVQSTQDKFGHYQCNSAMKLAKQLGTKPREIADNLITHLDRNDENGHPMIQDLSVAGPGFINITFDPDFLSKYVNNILTTPHLGIDLPQHIQRIIIDFSSPNTAKEMHVGHLRSTIIGDCLARLFEFLGHDVLRLNHIGDWGTAFGMLITYMKEKAPEVLQGKEKTNLTHLVTWYKEAKQQFDTDPDFKKRSQLEVVALQSGNKEALQAWEIICDISRRAYQEIYDLLDIVLQERGESFYNPVLAKTVADLEAKGLVTLSQGAKCIFLEGFQNREGDILPLMIQKSDGGYNYDTTDIAAIRQRIEEEKGDRLIYVTDAGQAQHFKMIFKAAEKAGYLNPEKVRTDHVPFGLVLGNDGKKFRTRSGETEKLIDLIHTAIGKASEILTERSPEMPQNERDALAKDIGIGAIKYADLSCHRTSDYTFSYERMLRFDGNTAAFLMYAYVRIAGIKRKVNTDIAALKKEHQIVLEHPSEIALAVHLAQFSEALDMVAEDLLPNRLTDYLYLLAEKFNAFFRDCRVEGSPQQNSRLLLCETVALVMKQGLEILGLKPVDKM